MLACAKHFPGHGRTTVDSHKELPLVDVDAETLRATDLVPFGARSSAESRRLCRRMSRFRRSIPVAHPGLSPHPS